MFQNVAYRPTVYKTGGKSINLKEKPQQFACRFGWVRYSIVKKYLFIHTIDVSMSTFSCPQGKRHNTCVIYVSLFPVHIIQAKCRNEIR